MKKIEKRRIRAKEDDKVAGDTASTPTASDGMSPLWRETMSPFFEALGISLKEGTERILAGHNGKKLIRAANDRAAQQMRTPRYVSPENLRAIFGSDEVPEADFHEAMDKLQGAPAARPSELMTAMGTPSSPNLGGRASARKSALLPELLEGSSFLEALTSTSKLAANSAPGIQTAIEAYFCADLGIDDILERLHAKMVARCEARKVPVTKAVEEFGQLARRRQLAAYKVTPEAATDANRRKLLNNLQGLNGALLAFHGTLEAWHEELHGDRGMERLFDAIQGRDVEYPDHGPVVAASDAVVDLLAGAFGGYGEQTIRFLAQESRKIRENLERDDLPQLIGAETVEEMQEALGYRVNRADLEMQRAVARYTIAVGTVVPNLPAGQEGPTLKEVFRLGRPIKAWMETGRIGSPASNFPKPVGRNQPPTPILGNGATRR